MGGAHCIIVPTDGNTTIDQFWAVLSAYDPDYIYYYQKMLADLKTSSLAAYDAKLAEFIAIASKDGPPLSESDKQAIEKKVLQAYGRPKIIRHVLGIAK